MQDPNANADTHCQACKNLLGKRVFMTFDDEGKSLMACSEPCARLVDAQSKAEKGCEEPFRMSGITPSYCLLVGSDRCCRECCDESRKGNRCSPREHRKKFFRTIATLNTSALENELNKLVNIFYTLLNFNSEQVLHQKMGLGFAIGVIEGVLSGKDHLITDFPGCAPGTEDPVLLAHSTQPEMHALMAELGFNQVEPDVYTSKPNKGDAERKNNE